MQWVFCDPHPPPPTPHGCNRLLFFPLPAPTFWYLLRSSVTEKGPFLISSFGPTVYARRVKCFTGTTAPRPPAHTTPLGRLIMQRNIQMLCSVLGCRATSRWGSSDSYYWWCSYVQEFVYYCEGPLCVSSLMSAKCYALFVINNETYLIKNDSAKLQ